MKWIFSAAALLALASIATAADRYSVHYESVLGTSLDLIVQTDFPESASRAEEAALREIDRLQQIFSTYDSSSEVSRWMASHKNPQPLSADLTALLRRCDDWRTRSNGAFDPGVELQSRAWKAAEQMGQVPGQETLRKLVDQVRAEPWTWADSVPVASGRPLSFSAIAKGAVIDAACEAILRVPGVDGAAVTIGGDLKVVGQLTRSVQITSPSAALTGATAIDVVPVSNEAMATSSGKYRGFQIGATRYSHLLDPRTGRPVDHILSASVRAPLATDADALATICSVLTIPESLRLIDSIDDASCLIVDRDGRQHRSRNWNSGSLPVRMHLTNADPAPAKVEPWNGGFELNVDLEINQAVSGGRYRRPYVAVWVEDADGVPVKTIVLWVQSTGPGPRWIPDLKRWYRSDRIRKLADETDLVATISESTRKPGAYSVTWDGRDDGGKLLKPGEYTLYVEAAREHGTYQLAKKKVTLGNKSFKESMEANTEIKAASFDYRKSTPKPAG